MLLLLDESCHTKAFDFIRAALALAGHRAHGLGLAARPTCSCDLTLSL